MEKTFAFAKCSTRTVRRPDFLSGKVMVTVSVTVLIMTLF